MTTSKDIFESLPGRFNADAAGDWNTTVQFHITGDGGGDWTLKVADGVCAVTEGSVEGAVATLTTDNDTWVGINTGAVNPMMAFSKMKIDGNMGELMKLQSPAIFKR